MNYCYSKKADFFFRNMSTCNWKLCNQNALMMMTYKTEIAATLIPKCIRVIQRYFDISEFDVEGVGYMAYRIGEI